MQVIADKRQRVGVLLYKSGRATTKYYCYRCKNYIAELSGTEVRALTDLVATPTGVSVRCSGNIEPGVKCHLHHVFIMGDV